ncbi:MAG: hypothetical protein ACXW1Y_09375 [Acidimicrobiia bacterium]
MRWVFGIALVVGILSMIGWAMLPGRRTTDPGRMSQKRAPQVMAALVAFGMGGLSASYAGWSVGLAIVASFVAATLAAWYATRITSPGGEGRD